MMEKSKMWNWFIYVIFFSPGTIPYNLWRWFLSLLLPNSLFNNKMDRNRKPLGKDDPYDTTKNHYSLPVTFSDLLLSESFYVTLFL